MAAYFSPYMQNQGPFMYGGSAYPAPMQQMSQSYAPTPSPMQSNVIPVDGEVGAKAYSIPNGAAGPIALWDTNDNVIYLRTFNAAGMPNPLKKLRYVEEEPMQNLPGQSGGVDTSQFVTKQDFEALRQEIRQMAQNQQNNGNQNGSQNGRGGNSQNNQGRQN